MKYLVFLLICCTIYEVFSDRVCPEPLDLELWGDLVNEFQTYKNDKGETCYITNFRHVPRVSSSWTYEVLACNKGKDTTCMNRIIGSRMRSTNLSMKRALREMKPSDRILLHDACEEKLLPEERKWIDLFYNCIYKTLNGATLDPPDLWDKDAALKYLLYAISYARGTMSALGICKAKQNNEMDKLKCDCSKWEGSTCKFRHSIIFSKKPFFLAVKWIKFYDRDKNQKMTPASSTSQFMSTASAGFGGGDVNAVTSSQNNIVSTGLPQPPQLPQSPPPSSQPQYAPSTGGVPNGFDNPNAQVLPTSFNNYNGPYDFTYTGAPPESPPENPGAPQANSGNIPNTGGNTGGSSNGNTDGSDPYDDFIDPPPTDEPSSSGPDAQASSWEIHKPRIEGPTAQIIECEKTEKTVRNNYGSTSLSMMHSYAAQYLMHGLVETMREEIGRPFFGHHFRKILPYLNIACGDNLYKFPSLREFIFLDHPTTDEEEKGYYTKLYNAAVILRTLDRQGRIILTDYRGSGSKSGDGIDGMMRKVEAQWATGKSQIIPCRSILSMINSFVANFKYEFTDFSQCEDFFGIHIGNSNNKGVNNERQRLVCQSNSKDQHNCMKSCKLYRPGMEKPFTPSSADQLLACMPVLQTSGQTGTFDVDDAGLPVFKDQNFGAFLSGTNKNGEFEMNFTPSERCKVKQSALTGFGAMKAKILSRYPELSQPILATVDGIETSTPIYMKMKGSNPEHWVQEVRDRLGPGYINQLTSQEGGANLIKVVQGLCNEPDKFSHLVFNNPRELNNFLECRHILEKPMPLPIEIYDPETGDPDCDFIRDMAGAACKLRYEHSDAQIKKQIWSRVGGFFFEVLDMYGCVSMAGPLGTVAKGGVNLLSKLGSTVAKGSLKFASPKSLANILVSSAVIVRETAAASLKHTIAHAARIPSAIPLTAVFTGYGIYETTQAEKAAELALAESVANCYATGTGCDGMFNAQAAYERVRMETMSKVISYSVLGLLIPGSKLNDDELMAAAISLRKAKQSFYGIKTSSKVKLKQLAVNLDKAKEKFHNIFKKKFICPSSFIESERSLLTSQTSHSIRTKHHGTPKCGMLHVSGDKYVSVDSLSADDAHAIYEVAQLPTAANIPNLEQTPAIAINRGQGQPLPPEIRQEIIDIMPGGMIRKEIIMKYSSRDIAEAIVSRRKKQLSFMPKSSDATKVTDQSEIMFVFGPNLVDAISENGVLNTHQTPPKNRIKSAKSQGSLKRTEIEWEVSGLLYLEEPYIYGPNNPVNDLRPVSTLINHPEGFNFDIARNMYGHESVGYMLVFDDSVKRRSLYVDGDSGLMHSFKEPKETHILGTPFGYENSQMRQTRIYKEALIFGELGISDVKHVLVPKGTLKEEMLRVASKTGKPVYQFRQLSWKDDMSTLSKIETIWDSGILPSGKPAPTSPPTTPIPNKPPPIEPINPPIGNPDQYQGFPPPPAPVNPDFYVPNDI